MIYVYSHRDYSEYPKDKVKYCSISHKEIKHPFEKSIVINDSEILNEEWNLAEVVGLKYLYKNQHLLDDDVIGYAHYRDWYNNDELGDYDAILPTPLRNNMREQYRWCHNINDFDEMVNIVKEKYPDYETNSDVLYTRNMFIAKKEHFIKYCEFLFDILEEFEKRKGIHSDSDVNEYVTKNIQLYPGRNVREQSRLCGFLSERITTIFINNYFKDKKVRHENVTMIDKWNIK